MKKFFFYALAATAMLAVSCEKENLNGSVNQDKGFFGEGDGWVKLNLNLPSIASTKANDVFDDGLGFEYAVENARLVLFGGSIETPNEDACTLRSAYELSSGDWNKDDNTQITTTRTITQKVMSKNFEDTEYVYAFVILNDHFFDVKKSTADAEVTSLYNGSSDLTGTTFAAFKKLLLDESNKDFNNIAFTMTNMPHVHGVGATATPATVRPWSLVRFDKTKIYKTEADALGGEAGAEIDVERVVAKVTVNVASGVDHLENAPTVALSTLGWFIDNTNPEAYVVRNVEDPVNSDPYAYLAYNAGATYRMVAKEAVHSHPFGTPAVATPVVRTYWGIDPNYNADATGLVSEAGHMVKNELMHFLPDGTNDGGRLRAAGTSYYCAENTFDVKHQTVKNTTRVIVAVQFNGSKPADKRSFVTLTSEPNVIMDNEAAVKKVKTMILKRVNVSNWLNEYFVTSGTEEEKEAQLLALLNVTVTPDMDGANYKGTAKATVALGGDPALTAILKGGKTLAAAKTAYGVIAADQTDYVNGNINNQLNYYKDGVAYYQALIRHFDNTETPWEGEVEMSNVVTSIYKGTAGVGEVDENAYLGRYGVLRNNWYDINITAIRQIGSSVVPELTDEPDDVVEQYIKVKINIMPWAKRTQNVIL